MTVVQTIRGAIKAAIVALPGLASVRVVDAPTPEKALQRLQARNGTSIAVCYSGKPKLAPGYLSGRTAERFSLKWSIVIYTDNWQTPIGAQDELESVSEVLLGLRAVQLAEIDGEAVYLEFESERSDFGEAEAYAGAGVLVQEWQANEVRL